MNCTIRKLTPADAGLWEELYRSNPSLTPYQAPEFMRRYLKTARMGKRRILLKSQILVAEVNEKAVICPMAVDHRHKAVYFLGDFSSVGYCDLIYGSDVEDCDFEAVISALRAHFAGYALKLNKVNENTGFGAFLLSKYTPVKQSECVSIALNGSYDDYYQSLSKHARQNIRTAYNRMSRDGKTFSMEFCFGEKRLSGGQLNEMYQVYCWRMKEKFGKETLPYPLMWFAQRHINPLNRCLAGIGSQFHALLYIDGELAAFMSGFFNSDSSRIVLPKLSMNSKFNFYDPGIVLIKETAAYLCQRKNHLDLDLSRGNEKYKYAMGGQTHYNYSFEI